MTQDKSKTTELSKKKSTGQRVRISIQIFFFILVGIISFSKILSEIGYKLPFEASLHAICPFGGVVSIYTFITVGTFVQKIHESSFVLMVAAFILAILLGPVICGWVCPFGSFQEWVGKIGKKIFGNKYNHFVPVRFDNYLRYLRYFVLIWVIYVTATSAKLVFKDADPYYALFNFFSDDVSLISFFILGVIILLSLFVERPWCKYACPYGALLGIFNLFRIFNLKRNVNSCIDCKLCDKACPMNIKISNKTTIRNHQCISCLKCTSENACPIPETIDFVLKGDSK